MWYRKAKDYSIHTTTEWSYTKDEQETDGRRKEHSQQCRVRTRIIARGSGYNMLPGQSIILISVILISAYDKTPHEVWYAKKPSLQHLRVFACDAYVHVPK